MSEPTKTRAALLRESRAAYARIGPWREARHKAMERRIEELKRDFLEVKCRNFLHDINCHYL